jgi:hypothetical protein
MKKESKNLMFATILRRWRLVTPLALAVLAIAVVTGGVFSTGAASAHNPHFHFWGRAYALSQSNTLLPLTACDTGYLPLGGLLPSGLSTGPCFGVYGPAQPGGASTGLFTINHVQFPNLYAIYANDSVVASHGSTKGSVVATADLEGSIDVCITAFLCSNISASLGEFATCPSAVTLNDKDQDHPRIVQAVFFCAEVITEKVTAFCHSHSNGSTQAYIDPASGVTRLVNGAVDEDGSLVFLGGANSNSIGGLGTPNQTFTISGNRFQQFRGVSILVTINELHTFVDGDLGAVSGNAVHLVVSDDDGNIEGDFIIAHAFAAIHCARHLGVEENIPGTVGE